MAKQRKRRDDEAALFVRLPREEAEKLDRFVFERRIPKRDVVRRLVAEHLDEADVMWQRPMPPPMPMPIPPGAEVVVGRADFVPTEAAEVLDIDEVAELLQVEPDAVRELAESGGLPARKIGDEWRFLRRAVLAWLGGAEPPDRTA
jgi:excisionase family DNA binding protein